MKATIRGQISKRAAFFAITLAMTRPFAGPVHAVAFDCVKASREVEKLIRGDKALSELDDRLAQPFKAAHANLSDEQRKPLEAEQRGWIKGRNECWKAEDNRACTETEYRRRIVKLEARYGLAEVGNSVYYTCDDGKLDDLVFTPVATDPQTANIVRGKISETLISEPTASGTKYFGDFGALFWSKGAEAQVEWPQGQMYTCIVRKWPRMVRCGAMPLPAIFAHHMARGREVGHDGFDA